ncbi:sigma-70 family RNA polymerase sigma factor [Aeoliella sp.]|uniref:sigma-70 family RNA polymerase sigma factor n=1 Tax=Aeoliella sp. TaxID=2795800 RepID=UPI003CCB76B4
MSDPDRSLTESAESSLSSDDARFIDLLQQHRTQLLGYLFCIVQNMDDAEDLFQQVSITLWDKFDTFEQGSSFSAWAITVARNKAMTFLRSKRRETARFSRRLIEELSLRDLWTPLEADSRLAALQSCQKKLPKEDQVLLSQCYSTSEKTADVARRLGRSVDSVYTSLSRIRRALFACIKRSLAREERV